MALEGKLGIFKSINEKWEGTKTGHPRELCEKLLQVRVVGRADLS